MASVQTNTKKNIIAIPWYGGKYIHLNWLLPLLPECNHFVDVFGGGASVILNRKPSPIETYNDINGELVNFFRVLRNNAEKMTEKLYLMPYSREEFNLSQDKDYIDSLDCVDKAIYFFIRISMSFAGKGKTWGYAIGESRRKISGSVSKFMSKIDGLKEVSERLIDIQIENLPALDILERYDTNNTLFYIDPPYCHESREKNSRNEYDFEMTDKDHIELSEMVKTRKGKAAISGYKCELMDELYHDWYCISNREKSCYTSNARSTRIESLWCNYNPLGINGQLTIFDL